MEGSITDMLMSGLAGGAAAGGVVVSIFLYYRSRTDSLINGLKQDIKTLKSHQLHDIKAELDEHIKNDSQQRLFAELEQIKEQNGRLFGKLDQLSDMLTMIREETASQRSDIKNNHSYIENVNKSLINCKNIHHKA